MTSTPFPPGFLWGAATSAHQTEGANTGSDWWHLEHRPGSHVDEPSADACDSFHRWPEDVALAAAAGLTSYRFSIEWARVEPAPGEWSRAALAHYRAMIEAVRAAGLVPLVTLHHFTLPAWFAARGGWTAPDAADRFAAYCRTVAGILDGVPRVCTINEPNVVALFPALVQAGAAGLTDTVPEPDAALTAALIDAHHAARAALRGVAATGWSIASQSFHPTQAAAAAAAAYQHRVEDVFLDAASTDDWIGVQAYTRRRLDLAGGRLVPDPDPAGPRTLTGWEYYPAALAECVRRTWERLRVPVVVTENGIATADDGERIRYLDDALRGLAGVIGDGADVRGYYHWSLLDNYEWGSYRPTFGLVAVDRTTFERRPKPSLRRLGAIAAHHGLPAG